MNTYETTKVSPELPLESAAAEQPAAPPTRTGSIDWKAYVEIARIDHWFKNVFMLAGVLLAYLYFPGSENQFTFWGLTLGLLATCLVASSNYVINEVLDARTDLEHPIKRLRPIPAGRVWLPAAYAEWIALGVIGLAIAWTLSLHFFIAEAALLFMGLVYNVRPIRSKDLPYLDVLSESINNPLRLLLGWFVVNTAVIPPASLLVSYWLVGAFFMATKRFAEYRSLGDAEVAAAYRKSFKYYDADRLLVSMFVYACGAAMLLGVFIIRYHFELILSTPLIAGFFGYYLIVALKEGSAVQNPERLYRERGLMAYLVLCVVVFLGLMFIEIPALQELFNVSSSRLPPLWRL